MVCLIRFSRQGQWSSRAELNIFSIAKLKRLFIQELKPSMMRSKSVVKIVALLVLLLIISRQVNVLLQIIYIFLSLGFRPLIFTICIAFKKL